MNHVKKSLFLSIKDYLKSQSYDFSKRALDLSLTAAVMPTAGLLAITYAANAFLQGGEVKLSKTKVSNSWGNSFYKYSLVRSGHFSDNIVSEILDTLKVSQFPVLLNIFKGEMSVVGPFAEVETEDTMDSFKVEVSSIKAGSVKSIKPGLVNSHYIKSRMNIAHEPKEVTDLSDASKRDIAHDLSILVKAVPALFMGGKRGEKKEFFEMLGLKMCNTSMEDAVQKIIELAKDKKKRVAFVNPHCFNILVKNQKYKKVLESADLLYPDGIGLQIATKLNGISLESNINGTDMLPVLCREAQAKGLSIGLLGGKEDVAQKAKDNLLSLFPHLKITVARNGYFENEQEEVQSEINSASPDILLVAMGVPLQEIWIEENIEKLNIGVAIGVGGLFDFYSGNIKRAPMWVREMGFEWLWRVAMEPRRMFLRYFLGNPLFLYYAICESIESKKSNVIYRFYKLATPYNRKVEITKVALRKFLWWSMQSGTLKLKRALDIVGAAGGIVLLSPIFFLTALAIKVEDFGPVFYKQRRVGRHGKEFDFYKFRSMVLNASEQLEKLVTQNESEAGVIFKMKKDPRVTFVGRFIRRYSIDELPQLLNVLRGDMSLVGPRPPLPSEVAKYKVGDRYRLDVIPGLTCLWQVKGRSNLDFNAQIKLDSDYIKSRGFFYDLFLIARTIPVVLTGQGAY